MAMTISNPADSTQMYTWGTRGKRPKFVVEGLANGTIKMPQEYADRKIAAETKAAEPTSKSISEEPGLKAWKYVGQIDIDPRLNNTIARCVIVANDMGEAIRLFNRTTKNPVTKYEFVNFWKQVSNDEFSLREIPAVYEQMKVDNKPKDETVEPKVKVDSDTPVVPEPPKEKETITSVDIMWVVRKDLHIPLVLI